MGDPCLTLSFDGNGALGGVPADITGTIDAAGACRVQIPDSTGMTPASPDQSFRGWSTDSGAITTDSNYSPGRHQYEVATLPSSPVKLYAVWRTTPAPTDVKAVYHSDKDTVTVSGKADDLTDRYGTVTLCLDESASSTSCTPSGINVSSVFSDPSDSGRFGITATANRLDPTGYGTRGTWAGALVCPADTPFPAFDASHHPVNAQCSMIEILTNSRSGGVGTNVDGFTIGGRFTTPSNTDYMTTDGDFKNGSGLYDIWVFTRSQNFEVMGTPQRAAWRYQYTAPQALSASAVKATSSGSKTAVKSGSKASAPASASASAAARAASGTVSTRSDPVPSRTQEFRVQGSGSHTWSVTFSAADFVGWYPRDTNYYLSAVLTLDSAGFTTPATSALAKKSAVLPWLEVDLDSNAAHSGPTATLSPLYAFLDGDSNSFKVTLPGQASIPGASGKLLGWSSDAEASSSSGTIYAVGKQGIPTTGGIASSSGHGTIVTLYAIWGVPPTPYDLKIAYHRSTDTVDVTGKVDTGTDTGDVVSVCMTDEAHSGSCENTSGIRVEGMKVDPEDPGKISITGTADSLKGNDVQKGTWVQALVCPAGVRFPNFTSGGATSDPSNRDCSNIEMLTENGSDGRLHSMGVTDKRDGFKIGGHYDTVHLAEEQEWTTSDSDFKKGHGLYDIWIYERDEHFAIVRNNIKLIGNYGFYDDSKKPQGTDSMYVQLHGTGVQDWTISYPKDTFVAKFPIGTEHHLQVRLNIGEVVSEPADLDGTLPWLKATFKANASNHGSGTPPGELRALIDYDERNGLITLPAQGDLTGPEGFDFIGWNRNLAANEAGKDDMRPGHSSANDTRASAAAYFDQQKKDVDYDKSPTETDVTLYAIWRRAGSVLPLTGGLPRMLVLLAALLGISLMVLGVTHVLRERFTKSR